MGLIRKLTSLLLIVMMASSLFVCFASSSSDTGLAATMILY
jgi:hypothetical protein